MSDSFTSIYVHIIFHIKSTGYTMEETHLPRIFDYIGGAYQSRVRQILHCGWHARSYPYPGINACIDKLI